MGRRARALIVTGLVGYGTAAATPHVTMTNSVAAVAAWAAARAQANPALEGARLAGRVTDTESNPLPGVVVTVHGAGASRTVVTDGDGRYQFEGLAPGTYTVAGELVGFQTASGAVALAAPTGATLDLVMKVGCIEERSIVMMPLEYHARTAEAVALVRVVSRGEPRRWAEGLPCPFAGTEYDVDIEDGILSRSDRWPVSGAAVIVRGEREPNLDIGAQYMVFLHWSEGLELFVVSDMLLSLGDGRLATVHDALEDLNGLSANDASRVLRHLASQPVASPPVSLGELTVPADRLLPGCTITPRVSEASPDGKVTGGLWVALPISSNPWQGTDPVVAGQIHERMFAPPISDAPLPTRREMAMSRLKAAEDVVESYAAVYREASSGALTTVTALQFRDADVARRWWRQRPLAGMQSILAGPIAAAVSGSRNACRPVIAAHLRSFQQ